MPSTLFDNLLNEINETHNGRVGYSENGEGRAIRSNGDGQNRNYGFQIYNNASWGSRTVQRPPSRLGSRVRRFAFNRDSLCGHGDAN